MISYGPALILNFFLVSGGKLIFSTILTFKCFTAYRCFQICSSSTKLHAALVSVKLNFLKNGYPKNFINKCFKKFFDNIHVVKENTLTVEMKPLVLVLPYLGLVPLQARSMLEKSLKSALNYCKLETVLKIKTRLGSNFHFKEQITKDSGAV